MQTNQSGGRRNSKEKKNRRDKLYKRKQRGMDIEEYLTAEKDFSDLSETCHQEYIDNVQKNIKSNPAEFWQYAKLNNKNNQYPSVMYYNDICANTPSEIVELFAQTFENTYDKDDQTCNLGEIFNELPNAKEINISLFDIEYAINSLKWKGSKGPDDLSSFVIKMCIDEIVWPIWLLFQKIYETGVIPATLKTSKVIPIHKKGDKTRTTNYRVIAIDSVILKIFELAIKRKLMVTVEPLLSNAQHGFRPKRSVVTNLMNLSTTTHESFVVGKQTDIFYGDFKSAFDKVWHRQLFKKLIEFKIGNKTAKLLFELITKRCYFVQIGQNVSRTYTSTSGVTPGSVLGPTFFSIFINDLPNYIEHSQILMFADDVKLYKIICNAQDAKYLH